MLSRCLLVGAVTSLLCTSVSLVCGQAVPWQHPDGSTHWYEAVSVPVGITWKDAQAAAHARGGHLVTVTSTPERDFVAQLADDPSYWFLNTQGEAIGPWIGGVQKPGASEPFGGWQWVTGEPFAYSNWSPTQPNDATGDEDHLHLGDGTAARVGTWSDFHELGTLITLPGAQRPDVRGYIIEWDGHAPDQTFGRLINKPAAGDGYTTFATIGGNGTIPLIDRDGRVVHSWTFIEPAGYSSYILDDGAIVRSLQASSSFLWNGIFVGGLGGAVERRAWDGTLEWRYEVDTPTEISHHDVQPMPNGNVLITVFEQKTAAEAIAQGRDPARLPEGQLWPDKIIEVMPTGPTTGSIIWEWKVWDHLVQDFDPALPNYGDPAQHPELLDLNYAPTGIADWNHVNSVSYNETLDQILLTVHCLDEIWIIDHSTTLQEAAGHTGGNSGKGGDLLYRWGNPQAYRAGTEADRVLFGPHHADWIPAGYPGAGNILLYNNGLGRGAVTRFSSIDELTPFRDANGTYLLQPGAAFGPSQLTWQYTAPNKADFYSPIVSGAQRLANGNTLIAEGTPGRVFEVTPGGEEVWRYENPITANGSALQGTPQPDCVGFGLCNRIFRATRYEANHPGLVGRNLVPGDPVELYPTQIEARFGTVNRANGGRESVLRVNGSAGDVWREVYVDDATPVTLTVDAPSTTPNANFILFAFGGEPGVPHVEVQPFLTGSTAFPFPIVTPGTIPGRVTLADTTNAAVFGAPLVPGVSPAPSVVLQAILPIGTVTFQGLIVDSTATVGVNLTNAVVLSIY